MARKTRAESALTRTQLLDAAETVFLRRGVARSSLDEIARSAGLTRGAIYWHFQNKADLVQALLDRVRLPLAELLPELEGAVGNDPLRTLRELCIYALRSLGEDPRRQRVYTILFHRCEFVDEVNPMVAHLNHITGEFLRLLEGYFEAARRNGTLNPALAPGTAAHAVHVYLLGLYRDWLRNPAGFDIVAAAPRLADALFGGLVNPSPEASGSAAAL